jgi:hypothetical protein
MTEVVSQVSFPRLVSELCDCETEYQSHWLASGFCSTTTSWQHYALRINTENQAVALTAVL